MNNLNTSVLVTYDGDECGYTGQRGFALRREGQTTPPVWVSVRLLAADPECLDRYVMPMLEQGEL